MRQPALLGTLALLIVPNAVSAQGTERYEGPIIDMHLHAHTVASCGPEPVANCTADEPVVYPGLDPRHPMTLDRTLSPCDSPIWSAATDEELLRGTLAVMERHNIVRAVVGGPLEEITRWHEAAPERIIPAVSFLTGRASGDRAGGVEDFRRLIREGRIEIFAEVGAQCEGLAPNDPSLDPFYALAEELDIPIGMHLGEGPPGAAYDFYPNYRAALGRPLLLEEVLIHHPRMRIYVMHAGWPLIEEMMAILYSHPQVYVDIAGENWGLPRKEFHRYLQRLVEAGFGQRILFGSDQMVWPQTIGVAIESIQSAEFLTLEQKQDIFYGNAARLLRLSEEEIALHHGRSPQEVAPPATTPPTPVPERSPVQTPTAPESLLLDGVEIHLVEQGTGTPVVLVHGSLADYTYWELSDQISLLAPHHRVIAYSRRYNYPNRNERSTNHSPMVEAEDLAALIDRGGTGPVHLVGHSYGAYTALVYALENPEQVRSLVLAEPPIISWLPDIPGGEGIYEGFMASVWKPLAEAFSEGGTAGGLDFTARWYFQVPWEEVTAEWQTLFSRNADEWHALALSTRTYPKVDYDRVGGLDVPVLLLSAGQNAGGFNDLVDGHLEHLLPNAERLIIPDVSHEMFLDDREASARAMLDFFRAH